VYVPNVDYNSYIFFVNQIGKHIKATRNFHSKCLIINWLGKAWKGSSHTWKAPETVHIQPGGLFLEVQQSGAGERVFITGGAIRRCPPAEYLIKRDRPSYSGPAFMENKNPGGHAQGQSARGLLHRRLRRGGSNP
jgi:hypothetical protein